MNRKQIRSVQEIFEDLAILCKSQGFIHAVAIICFRDNYVKFDDKLRAEDMAQMYLPSRLIRTEVTTLIGLMMRAPIDFVLPEQKTISDYINNSEVLLEELHHAMTNIGDETIVAQGAIKAGINPFTFGECLREPIFYSGESTYPFQYRDLAPRKYRADADWLLQNKDIDMEVGREVCRGVGELLNNQLIETRQNLQKTPTKEWSMLPGFAFSCDELASRICRPSESVRAVVEAFTFPETERNFTFTTLHAYNAAYAYPFIRKGADEFLMLQHYGISEAIYETPFYWMCDDKMYATTALRHRGEYTEEFAAERLEKVFGNVRVFRNVELRKSKREILGEIDVLVLFGDRAIVLQAKSKRLTLEARGGNSRKLQEDFKKAVQDAVDQAIACAESLNDPSVSLHHNDRGTVSLSGRPRNIFPITVIADHYPALAFQVRQFLKAKSNEQIVPPLVIDVFALDAITEMLSSPLRFLSYICLRAHFGNKLMMQHEHMLLSYHLKRNLWVDENIDLKPLDDDVSTHLDVAMAVRRDGIPGEATPDGILTRFEGTPFARIITEIEDISNPAAIDLGLMLLELGENTVQKINENIERILDLTTKDGSQYHMTMGIPATSSGLTVHCSRFDIKKVENWLYGLCKKWKYFNRANSWFGLAIRPDGSIQLASELKGPWKFDSEMESVLANTSSAHQLNAATDRKIRKKIGRNNPCPCGSGKKYKYCCINR